MTALQDWFLKAAAAHGLRVDLDVSIPLPSGKVVHAPVHLRGVGAARGMLIATQWKDLEAAADELVEAGYGYSVMDEPLSGSDELASFQDLLDDWGATESEPQVDCPLGPRPVETAPKPRPS
jgi:hypothetical protein